MGSDTGATCQPISLENMPKGTAAFDLTAEDLLKIPPCLQASQRPVLPYVRINVRNPDNVSIPFKKVLHGYH